MRGDWTQQLGNDLARHLFSVGSDLQREATRIEFKSGATVADEVAMGGLCEEALARIIRDFFRCPNYSPEGDA